jgi:ADP-heptose:LPS heptosyltransferase
MNPSGKHIIISRTDSIGDVMLTLPICSWLKEKYTDVKITFLGKGYTRPIVESFVDVDQFEDWADYTQLSKEEQLAKLKSLEVDVIVHVFPNKEIAKLAKKAKIPTRIGTSHRSFHLLTCNERVNFTRRKSDLHEAQLNHELLRPLGLDTIPELEEVIKHTSAFRPDAVELPSPFNAISNYTILHPKSQGSAKEWPIEKYMQLATQLAEQGKKVVFTGTEKEGLLFREVIPQHENIKDSTGKLTLEQLIQLIKGADNLVACSTGPLHIAGYLGVNTIGLYAPKRPIHPGRWKALGTKVQILVNDENCPTCEKGQDCSCITEIGVDRVFEKIS